MRKKTTRILCPALKQILGLVGSLLALSSLASAQLVNIDFETAGDYGNNFRGLAASSASATQTSNGAANDYFFSTSSAASAIRIMVYDTTTASNVVQNTFTGAVTIGADIDASAASQSFGIYILNPSAESTASHLLALFNWDVGGVTTNDTLRFFKASSAIDASAGTNVYTSGNKNTGIDVASSFGHFSLNYRQDTVDSTQAIMNLTVGSYTTGDQFLGTGTYLSSYEVGLRFFPNGSGGTVSVDNFTVTQIPEPGSVSLLLAGAAVLVGFRIRSRRTA